MTVQNPLIFLHIPKTAGSTFHSILNTRYKLKETQNLFGSRYSEPEIKAFMDRPVDSNSWIRLLKGHMPFGLHAHLKGEAKYITVLRNPVDRVVSQYYYIKKNDHNPLHDAVEKGGMSISEFVESGISVGMNNGHCRFLNGDLDEYGFDQDGERLYKSAIANIENHFLWVGITERFDESVWLLSHLIGWKNPPYYIRENVSKNRKSLREIDKADLEVIKKFNRFDIKLYEHCCGLLDREIAKIEGAQEKIEEFKRKNASIQQRWGWLPERFKRFATG